MCAATMCVHAHVQRRANVILGKPKALAKFPLLRSSLFLLSLSHSPAAHAIPSLLTISNGLITGPSSPKGGCYVHRLYVIRIFRSKQASFLRIDWVKRGSSDTTSGA